MGPLPESARAFAQRGNTEIGNALLRVYVCKVASAKTGSNVCDVQIGIDQTCMLWYEHTFEKKKDCGLYFGDLYKRAMYNVCLRRRKEKGGGLKMVVHEEP